MELVRAPEHAAFEIELDALSCQFAAISVEAAFAFPAAAPVENLKSSLARILGGGDRFAPVAGRFVKRGATTLICCDNAGVPFTSAKEDSPAPSLDRPAGAALFDLVQSCVPTGDGETGDAPCRIKVTDFADGQQIIAISVCHAMLDAVSLGKLLAAWSASYSGKDVPTVSHDRSMVPAVATGMASLHSAEGVPEAWLETWRPFTGFEPKPYDVSVTTYSRSAEACAKLREKYAQDGAPLSTNDALVGELAEVLDASKVNVIMEWRSMLDARDYFGCALVHIDIVADSPKAVPSKLRTVLPQIRSREFVVWREGMGPSAPSSVMVNTWAKAFSLADVRFASTAADVTLGESMCKTRAKGFAGFGARYALVLPQTDGVKVLLWGTAEEGAKLGDGLLSSVGY